MWQSWLYLAKNECRAVFCLWTVGQYFVTNEETKQIIWEYLEHSGATKERPVRGHVEYSPLDNGFHELSMFLREYVVKQASIIAKIASSKCSQTTMSSRP